MGGVFLLCGNAALLSVSSYFDIKYKRIPNKLTLGMLSFLCCFIAVNVLITGVSPGAGQLVHCIAGAATPFFVMLPAEMLTQKQFGAGDKKALFVIGLSVGFWGSIFVIFGMLAGALLFSIFKRVRKKDHIALAPFILISYIVVCTGVVL